MFENEKDWIGHGFFWRPQPLDNLEEVQNMAGAATSDFDLLEDKFHHLKNSSIIFADYSLLQKDFVQLKGKSDEEIDMWLLDNAAYFSQGQVNRLECEFKTKLGLDKHPDGVDSVIDRKKIVSGIRQRSGGRAANLFIGGEYSFDSNGFLKADILNVKGLGTHSRANFKDSDKLTGMLSLGDALRELALERLIGRILELEEMSNFLNVVKTYAIIDTGLRYAEGEKDPASGAENQICVLTVRQRHSRALVSYNSYNFSGSLLMTGEDEEPSPVMRFGMRDFRKVLNKYGISAEMAPQTLFAKDLGFDVDSVEFLDLSLQGVWNIQIDAAFTHLMDFSDYYVLPTSSLNDWWKMTNDTLFSALVLEGDRFHCVINNKKVTLECCPKLLEQVCGKMFEEKGYDVITERVKYLEKDPKILISQGINGDKLKLGIKPKYCMCWYFELDDSEMSRWSLNSANSQGKREILQTIEKYLPCEKL